MTLRPKSPRAKSRWAALAVVVMMLTTGVVGGVLAALPSGNAALFELDKNAINDQNTGANGARSLLPLGNLAASITNATVNINVCATPGISLPGTPYTIEIEAEQMTVTGTHNNAFNGNCANKLRLAVTRGANSTNPVSHASNGLNNLVTLITTTTDKPGIDWNTVDQAIKNGDPECVNLGFAACEFVHDDIGNTIFTGGSTKDDLPISGWLHKNGSVPDKDEIINAAAVKATTTDGGDAGDAPDQILYVMADRYGVDGSTDMGFWFFKNAVAPQGIGGGQTAGFSGAHTDGDILLLSTFTNGGAVTTVRVFKWTGTAQNGTPGQTNGIFGDCVPGAANQNGCATVNDTTIPVGNWQYVAKISSTPGWVPAGGFLEAGINLSDLGLEGCFSGFLAETRSSPSIDATLKDFAFGTFESCGAKIQITPDDVNEVGENHTFTVKVFAGQTGAEQPIQGVYPTVTLTETLGAEVTGKTDGCVDDGPGGPNTGTNAQGECTVTFTSNLSGVVTGNASATVSFGGGTFNVSTNGQTGNSGAAVKRFVDASISIAPNGVNEVGENHEFTITVDPEKAGTDVTAITVTPTVLPAPDEMDTDCDEMSVDGPYTCTVTISNDSSGVFDIDATLSITFEDGNDPANSDTVNRSTTGNNGPNGNDGATKRFVDASITVNPNGVNEVGEDHIFTITATPELAGTEITAVTIAPSVDPAPDESTNTCATVAVGGPYECTVTISNDEAGVFSVDASVSFTFSDGTNSDTVVRSTSGNSGPNGDDGATKRFVDASISIAPNDVNEVNEAHVFTVTVTPQGAGTTVDSITISADASPNPDTDETSTCDTPDLNAGVYTCTLTIKSSVSGIFTANAATTITFKDANNNTDTITRDTLPSTAAIGAGPDGSGPATKRYVDASITVNPNGVNEVGEDHVFTVTVTPQLAGTSVTAITITPTVSPTPDDQSNTCALVTTVAPYTCTVTISNDEAGVFDVDAQVSITFSNGVQSDTVVRNTAGNSGPAGDNGATKRFVDASILIEDDDVNEVGDDHVFDITVLPQAVGTTIDAITITANATPDPDLEETSTCGAVTAAGPYTCTLTINSSAAGVFVANASVTITFKDGDGNSDTITRDTNPATLTIGAGPDGSGPATKRYVDAYITIGPDATNNVGDPHTFNTNVYQDDGLPASDVNGDGVDGFGPAPDDTIVGVTLTAAAGSAAVPVKSADTCIDPGLASGACDVTFTSATPGLVLGYASVTFDVGGVSLHRETDGNDPNSDAAQKLFVAGSIAWAKEYAGEPQGGATFEVCQTHTYDLEAGQGEDPFVEIAEEDIPCVTVVDDVGDQGYSGADEDAAPGFFLVTNKPLGRYEITETVAPPGFEIDLDVKIAEIVPGDNSADLTGDPFVNRRPILKITGFGYTNEPDGDQPFGINAGITTYTVSIHNYGTADALLTSSDLVVSDNATCDPDNSLDLSGITIEAGQSSVPIELTCTYDHPDPAEITATLNVKYTTNGLERTASGSPATITFTVDAD